MSNASIHCRGLSKRYPLAQRSYDTLRDSLARVVRPSRQNGNGKDQWITALDSIDLEVPRGSVLGIVGANGAGKSTLLKILSRITAPTAGTAELHGTVGSLLEVGMGFHPELTGRENVYLSAAILGMDRAYVRSKFDEIVAFAECEQFLEMPVKHYSSGMYTRLAFAVSAHLATDILIVDEVLAVGDTRFQNKCLGKINSVAHDGRTVVFVSHNMVAVEALCNRAIWINKGKIVAEGAPHQVIGRYLAEPGSSTNTLFADPEHAPGDECIRLRSARAEVAADGTTHPITVGTPISLEFQYWLLRPPASLTLVIKLVNKQGITVFTSGFSLPDGASPGLYRAACLIQKDLLNHGLHHVDVSIDSEDETIVEQANAISFDVLDSNELREGYFGEWPGAVRVNVGWSAQRLAGAVSGALAG